MTPNLFDLCKSFDRLERRVSVLEAKQHVEKSDAEILHAALGEIAWTARDVLDAMADKRRPPR